MTTIAYDGKLIASDSRATSAANSTRRYKCSHCNEQSNMVADGKNKIVEVKGSFKNENMIVAAGTGNSVAIKDAIDYLIAGGDLENYIVERNKFSKSQASLGFALMIVTDTSVFIVDAHEQESPLKKYPRTATVSIGSGSKAAKMAMDIFSCNASDAVSAASYVDDGTGGGISVFDFESGKMQAKATILNREEFKAKYAKQAEVKPMKEKKVVSAKVRAAKKSPAYQRAQSVQRSIE